MVSIPAGFSGLLYSIREHIPGGNIHTLHLVGEITTRGRSPVHERDRRRMRLAMGAREIDNAPGRSSEKSSLPRT